MAFLTLNLPSSKKDTPMFTPGIKGELLNGYVWDVGNQIPEDIVIGNPLPKTSKPRKLEELLNPLVESDSNTPPVVTDVVDTKEGN